MEDEEVGHGLALVARVRLLLRFGRCQRTVKPIDEWQLKEWVRGIVRKGVKAEIGDKDLVHRQLDEDGAAACWELLVWRLGQSQVRSRLLPLFSGVELNVGGVRLRCEAQEQDDSFDKMRLAWEAQGRKRPDTMVIRGLPSRWFAEPRVSTQASVLVTHSIFSKFGKIKNLEIVEDEEGSLHCQIWIQFAQFTDLCTALQALCGRSMQKEGSSLRACYELDWDTNDYFHENNVRKRRFEREHARKLANDARLARAQRIALEARRAEERREEEERRARQQKEEEERKRKQQIEEEELRRKQEEEEAERRRKQEEEEEERRRKQEEEEEERRREEELRLLQLAEEQRREQELKEQEEARRREEEEQERRRLEEVQRKNEEIREATRKLLQEQEEMKKEKQRQQKQVKRGEQQQQQHEDFGRWQLYLNEGGDPWPSPFPAQVFSRIGKRLRSVIVSQR